MSEIDQFGGWPRLPPELEHNDDAVKARASAIAAALVELAKAKRQAPETQAQSEAQLTQKLIDSLTVIATAGVDRARTGAQFVQTAASAIAALYTGVLGVLFVSGHTAPPRSLIPMMFLGLAIALATLYLAFVMPSKRVSRPAFLSIPAEDAWVRFNYISQWVRAITLRRAGALRAAVVSLFFGLIFLPIGLVQQPSGLAIPSIATNTFPPALVVTSAATTSPTPIPWPSPTVLPDPSLTAILYTAQLDEFKKHVGEGVPPDDAIVSGISGLVALIAVLVVATIWWDPRGWFRTEEPTAQQVEPPASVV